MTFEILIQLDFKIVEQWKIFPVAIVCVIGYIARIPIVVRNILPILGSIQHLLDWICIHGSTGEVVCVIKTTVRSGKPVLFPANGDIPNTSVTSFTSRKMARSGKTEIYQIRSDQNRSDFWNINSIGFWDCRTMKTLSSCYSMCHWVHSKNTHCCGKHFTHLGKYTTCFWIGLAFMARRARWCVWSRRL